MRSLRAIGFCSLLIVIICSTIITKSELVADEIQSTQLPRGAQYFLGTADELLIRVNIWGFVNKPGQYMVPSETDLISLLSYAGGPAPFAKLSQIKIIRKTAANENEELIEINVKEYIDTGEVRIPALKPDDTIIVKASKWYYFNLSLEFVSKIAVLAQVLGWYMYYMDRN